MTVENLETNGNQTSEEKKEIENKDAVALSVKEKSDSSPKGLQLAKKPLYYREIVQSNQVI